jgi:hypothetical protein
MTTAATRDRWVVMEVPLHGDISFEIGSLAEQLSPKPDAGSAGIRLRVVSPADRLTRAVIGYLEGVADRLVARRTHTRSRQLVETYWREAHESNLYFIYEDGHTLRPVSFAAAESTARAWAELASSHNALAHANVLVEFLRDTPGMSMEHAWDELRQALDLALMPEPAAPPVHVTETDTGAAIQTDPADARRATLLALGWPTSTEAGQRAGTTSRNPGQWAKDKRDARQLLGVWDEAKRTYRYPEFQFADDGTVRAEVKELLATMAEHPRWTEQTDLNGWRRTYWLYQPFRSLSRRALNCARINPSGQGDPLHGSPEGALAYLDQWIASANPEDALARTPAEVFAEDPQTVIAFAQQAAAAARPDTDVEGRLHEP